MNLAAGTCLSLASTAVAHDLSPAVVRIGVAESPSESWDTFVLGAGDATIYHRTNWIGLATELFGYKTYYLHAWSGSDLVGVLPLVHQKGFPFANRLVSLPYCNYGGVVGSNEAAVTLMNEAASLAAAIGCPVELRERVSRPVDWACDREKVTFLLTLPDSMEELYRRFGSKLRSQIKRTEREALQLVSGGAELVPEFYGVFAENMRDLGTPVYPRRFFDAVMQRLAEAAEIVVIRREKRPVAACLLLQHGSTIEIPWASCTQSAKARSINMRLYAEAFAISIRRGARTFDFGRCTVDSGTYRFKRQWGATPVPLHWYRRPNTTPNVSVATRAFDLASRLWQRLPMGVANTLGPFISPGLRW